MSFSLQQLIQEWQKTHCADQEYETLLRQLGKQIFPRAEASFYQFDAQKQELLLAVPSSLSLCNLQLESERVLALFNYELAKREQRRLERLRFVCRWSSE